MQCIFFAAVREEDVIVSIEEIKTSIRLVNGVDYSDFDRCVAGLHDAITRAYRLSRYYCDTAASITLIYGRMAQEVDTCITKLRTATLYKLGRLDCFGVLEHLEKNVFPCLGGYKVALDDLILREGYVR